RLPVRLAVLAGQQGRAKVFLIQADLSRHLGQHVSRPPFRLPPPVDADFGPERWKAKVVWRECQSCPSLVGEWAFPDVMTRAASRLGFWFGRHERLARPVTAVAVAERRRPGALSCMTGRLAAARCLAIGVRGDADVAGAARAGPAPRSGRDRRPAARRRAAP